jgi:hypothetical protein
MKRIIFTIAFGILLGMQAYGWDGGRTQVSFGVFFDALQPYGEWTDVSDYGYCWHPYGIDRHWRPYMNGRWVWSDYGWYWSSYEDWGWAPYHYGRWLYDDYYGWIWVPDYEWGPSWVQWRYADGYIGWAPLPPRAGFHFSIGIDVGDYGVPYFGWCFTAGFGFYNDHPGIFGIERNHHFLRMTRNVTNIQRNDRGVFNRGLDYRVVERMNRTTIRTARIEDDHDLKAGRGGRLDGDRLRVYRPDVRPDTRNDIENRIRNRSSSDTQNRNQSRGTQGVTTDRSRERSMDIQKTPDNRTGGNTEWKNTQPGNRTMNRNEGNVESRSARPEQNINRGQSGSEFQNRQSHPQNQPRFNIPERRESPQRQVAPERRSAPAQAPKIERRSAEPQRSVERGSGGGDHRSSGGNERSAGRRR